MMPIDKSPFSPFLSPFVIVYGPLIGIYEFVLWSHIGTSQGGRVFLALSPVLFVAPLIWGVRTWYRIYKRNLESLLRDGPSSRA